MRTERQAVAPPSLSLSSMQNGVLQRKCACGNAVMSGGECSECKVKKGAVQRKLAIGASNDPAELEADLVADALTAIPGPLPANITPLRVSRLTGEPAGNANEAAFAIDHIPASAGRPLDLALRQDMEQRFGHDFSRVRVHTDTTAGQSAKDANANAYTVGNDVVFGTGQFSPGTLAGRRLIAHELTHVVQQSGTSNYRTQHGAGPYIQRDSIKTRPQSDDAKTALETEAIALETEILNHSTYKQLDGGSKRNVAWIIFKAKSKPTGNAFGQRNYYLKKLMLAISTPFNGSEAGERRYGCSPHVEKQNREEVEAALKLEKDVWAGTGFEDIDEKAVATGTHKVKRKGQKGKTFLVDRSDPKNIRVQIKVKLNGKPDEVASIKKLEDAIERESHTTGYYLDIVFVDKSGPDVFEFSVVFCEWANSENWASDPTTLSHEVHHALGLDDRYDYIQSHAGNGGVSIGMRLSLFVEQMTKAGDPRGAHSKMSESSNPLLSEDVCRVAFPDGPERKRCIEARKDLDPAGIPPI